MPIFDGKFNTITMIAVIEHLKNLENVLRQCYTLLKNNGSLIITTPTPFGGKIHKNSARLGLTSKDAVEEHHRLYSYKDMKSLLTSHGFRIYIYQKFELWMNQMFVGRRMTNIKMSKKIKEIMQELYEFNFRLSWLHKIIGVDFFRCFEYSHAIQETEPKEGMNVLDIGATRVSFFPLFVASKGANVTVIDIDKSVYQLKRFAKKGWVGKNLKTLICDAQKMEFSNDTFDMVYCISTIEHISSLNGDIRTMKEISRVLKCGGKAIVTLPYGQYEESTWGRWFFRVYDYEAIENRLIKPSELQVEKIIFHEDSKVRKFTDILYKLPKPIRLSFGWTHFFFAKHFYDKDKADKKDAGMVIICLSKIKSKRE